MDDKTTARVEVTVEMETANGKIYLGDRPFSEVGAASMVGPWTSATEGLVAVLTAAVQVLTNAAADHGHPIREPKFIRSARV